MINSRKLQFQRFLFTLLLIALQFFYLSANAQGIKKYKIGDTINSNGITIEMGISEINGKYTNDGYPIKANGKKIHEVPVFNLKEYEKYDSNLPYIIKNIEDLLVTVDFKEMLRFDHHGGTITIKNLVLDRDYNVIWLEAYYVKYKGKNGVLLPFTYSAQLESSLKKLFAEKTINPKAYQLKVDYITLQKIEYNMTIYGEDFTHNDKVIIK